MITAQTASDDRVAVLPEVRRTERLVLGAVEPLAAALVVVEVLVLADGVLAR